MLILAVIAAILVVIISVAAVFIMLSKYQKAKNEAEKHRLEAVVAANAARVALGQRPIPGSGVTSAEMAERLGLDPHPARAPEPPPNRSETGRNLTQPRPRPRSRQSVEGAFSNMFAEMGTSMDSLFNGLTRNMNNVVEQATQLANVATSIARDAQTLIELGVTPNQIVVNQTRSWNLRNLNTLLGRGTRTLRLLETRHPEEYQNWGELVQRFMTSIQSGELVIRDNFIESASMSSVVTGPSGPRCSIGGQPTQPETKAVVEPEKPIPTRFERDPVI
jgi:hypothetical protein